MRLISPVIASAVADAFKLTDADRASPFKVYAIAERIRLENEAENVALEDIVDFMIARANPGLVLEIDPRDARSAMLGAATADPDIRRMA